MQFTFTPILILIAVMVLSAGAALAKDGGRSGSGSSSGGSSASSSRSHSESKGESAHSESHAIRGNDDAPGHIRGGHGADDVANGTTGSVGTHDHKRHGADDTMTTTPVTPPVVATN